MDTKSGACTVLVVDDEPMVLQLADDILRRFGYAVMRADSGRAGVALFQEKHNDIAAVLLDLVMPGMDGKEVFYQMRSLDPQAAIILSSGYPQDRDVDELLELGAALFIQKPYRITDLVRVVRETIEKREKGLPLAPLAAECGAP